MGGWVRRSGTLDPPLGDHKRYEYPWQGMIAGMNSDIVVRFWFTERAADAQFI